MFDFQKLLVYTKAKSFSNEVIVLLSDSSFDKVVIDQFKRASLSIMLNIAEGSSRFSTRDKRHFMVIARGSAFECVAILEFLYETGKIDISTNQRLFNELEEISKMLFALIKALS